MSQKKKKKKDGKVLDQINHRTYLYRAYSNRIFKIKIRSSHR